MHTVRQTSRLLPVWRPHVFIQATSNCSGQYHDRANQPNILYCDKEALAQLDSHDDSSANISCASFAYILHQFQLFSRLAPRFFDRALACVCKCFFNHCPFFLVLAVSVLSSKIACDFLAHLFRHLAVTGRNILAHTHRHTHTYIYIRIATWVYHKCCVCL